MMTRLNVWTLNQYLLDPCLVVLTLLVSLLLISLAACGQPATVTPDSGHTEAIADTSGSTPMPPSTAPTSAAPVVAPAGATTIAQQLARGIDVSGHSGVVDWRQVRAAGHTFAFVKATEGVDFEDSAFATHWPAMKAAGIIRGAYHFYVTEDDPTEQAAFFTSKVTLEPGDLVPVVDLELIGHNTRPDLVDRLHVYLAAIETHYGARPIIYTSANFWNAHLDSEFGEYPLWIAEYEVEEPNVPKGWTTWHLWQWQGDAAVPGVTKTADLSRINPAGVDLSVLVIPP